MEVVFIVVTSCFLLLGIAFGLLISRLMSRGRLGAFSDDVSEDVFSSTRYCAMVRLLDEADQKFLRSHPAWSQRMEKRFRKARIRIFRGYLRQLSEDFHQVCKMIKVLMVTSKVDRSHLAGVMIKQQYWFAVGMIHVELKLILYGFGRSRVDISGLIHSVETMRGQLQLLVAVAEPAGA
jgi:hypothetical protein